MTADEVLTRMSSQEMTRWQAYFKIKAEEQKNQEMVRSAESGAETRRWSR